MKSLRTLLRFSANGSGPLPKPIDTDAGNRSNFKHMSNERSRPLDEEWLKIGLAGPARRALVGAKLYRVSDLRKFTAEELMGLHGMGKSALARLKVIMNAKKIRFRE